MSKQSETATFGAGCFWCTEAVFKALQGVERVVNGYAGGQIPNPTYAQVCSGRTGHAEVAQITFDPGVLSYDQLVEIFFMIHDPTTVNRQGNDIGEQYRSVIFYHSVDQKRAAERVRTWLEDQQVFDRPMVTQLLPFAGFFPAEPEHQNYYSRNQSQPYCRAVINPKLAKLRLRHRSLLRTVP